MAWTSLLWAGHPPSHYLYYFRVVILQQGLFHCALLARLVRKRNTIQVAMFLLQFDCKNGFGIMSYCLPYYFSDPEIPYTIPYL